ncbi:hypothetical protein D3C84_723310 [compost metagenome]
MHGHHPLAGRIGNHAPGQQRDPDSSRYAGNDRFDGAELQRLGGEGAEAGQQRIQALAIGAAKTENHGLEIQGRGDILHATQAR